MHRLSPYPPLWSPPSELGCQTTLFRRHINQTYNLSLDTYEDLWRWSCHNRSDFWSQVWDHHSVIGHKGSAPYVDESLPPSANPLWFEQAHLNWAENQLRHASTHPQDIAIIQLSEPCPGWDPPEVRLSQAHLLDLVGRCQRSLRRSGVGKGDRVAWWGANCIEAVVLLLATSSIGAIFSSAAADFGTAGLSERLNQIRPKVLVVTNGVVYGGTPRPLLDNLSALSGKLDQMPEKIVVVSHLPRHMVAEPAGLHLDRWVDWLDESEAQIEFIRMGFNEPIWILFSSGTTGRPKAVVHRQGGMLLDSLREHHLAGDMTRGSVFFYYTTPGWMMFQYLVSGLATGATIVLYEGSPLKDPSFLWKTIDNLGVTIFGTSAKWIEQISKHYPTVKQNHSLLTLQQILSTGSPLPSQLYDFVYSHIKSDVLLGSITGGTDICSVFAGRNTCLPVFRGEIQSRMLGFALDTATTEIGAPGELICTRAFPIQPVGFWPLKGYGFSQSEVEAAQVRYQESYYKDFEGNWYHGDYVQITPSRSGNAGGVIMLGRSDGVLNPGGIRFGPTDIYSVLETEEFADCGVEETLVVGLVVDGGADEKVVLFVKMREGLNLDDQLLQQVRTSIRLSRSARHVPSTILQVSDIPVTLTGKKVEVPIRKLINGGDIESVNLATLRNPECLGEYMLIGERLRRERTE
ncbi:acetoacetate-CoA ligase [Tremella mesenterica]|uniref:Acetoacetate-CoA ligase n=1 Tax=Tremella mesenterica TaxID=5217 RepID=A0A4Q1B8D4_TREME|nr:acetoacetate-CoA ligase [Tremella mesenterica]